MAKTHLFRRLQDVARRVRATRRSVSGTRSGTGVLAASEVFSRREAIQLISAFAALPALSGCTEGANDGEAKDERVAVIGAGLAGTHCAWRLQAAGVNVTVYEASDRVGGRTFTGRGRISQDQLCELGGELIDSNHRFMWALTKQFKLELHDRFSGNEESLIRETWLVDGEVVPEAEIVRQFALVVEDIAGAVEAADGDDDAFAELDNMSLAEWLDEVVPHPTYPELNTVLGAAYVGEFGLELAEQSALNLIYLVGSDDAETFRVFGESDERYHIVGGNDQLTSKLAMDLGDKVQLEHVLVSAKKTESGYELEFETPTGKLKVACERIVFALPFTKLRQIDLSALELSEDKLTMIEELGYGTNAKVMGAFKKRVWAELGASGSSTTDLAVQQTWDSSVGQAGKQGILTNFSGGAQGVASGEGSAEKWYQGLLDDIDVMFPGTKAEYVKDSAVRMHWPTHKFTLGSYTCYKPGQWSFWGTEGAAENNVHFCGEHTSAEFQGWMEGAAETGGRVAAEILIALDRPIDPDFRKLLDDGAALPGQNFKSFHYPKRLNRIRTRKGL